MTGIRNSSFTHNSTHYFQCFKAVKNDANLNVFAIPRNVRSRSTRKEVLDNIII